MESYRFLKEDPENSYQPSCIGTVVTTVKVGGRERRALLYMPERARANSAPVTVLLPNGWTVERGLAETNWKQLADSDESRDKITVLFLEPPDGGAWNLDGAFDDPEGPAAYVSAAGAQIFGGCRYVHVDYTRNGIIGYGEGGTAAQMAALAMPTICTAVVSVGAPAVSERYMEAAGSALCDHLAFYTFSGADKGIRNRDVPVPVWIVDDPQSCGDSSAALLNYWKAACHTDDRPVKVAPDIDAYVRSSAPRHPRNQDREAFRVWHSVLPGAAASLGENENRRFWKYFLSKLHRIPGEPEGDLRLHLDPVMDCGAEYHYQKVDGWMREWFTYVPACVKANPEKRVPLVIAIHGYGCSGELYFNNVHWFRVAEERGFILVCPSGVNGGKYLLPTGEPAAMAPSWNQIADPDLPDEFVFFRELVELTCRAHSIDRSRIYATGHSNGSTTTHSLGLALPELFAGIGCIGGAIPSIFLCVLDRPEIVNRPDVKVPVWIFGGSEEADIMPAYPEDGNTTANTINLWLKNDGIAPVHGDGWKQGWVNRGIYHDVVYSDAARPLVRYTCVQDMPHAATTEMCYRLWDEFFSKFSRGADGEPCYQA